MNQFRFRLCLALCFLLPALLRGAEREKMVIENLRPDSEVLHDAQSGKWIGQHGVVIHYGTNATLIADQVSLDEESGDVLAEGAVMLQRAEGVWTGDRLTYNFRTRQMGADAFKAGTPPFFASGLGLSADMTNRTYQATNAVITTDDVAEPFFKIRARKLKIIPGEYIEAQAAIVKLGNVPIMYFPYYHRSLKRHPNNFEFTPGYRSLYGPYLLSTYNWYVNDHFDASMHLDYRQKRGFGAGPEFEYDFGRFGHGEFKYYYLRDENPGLDPNGFAIQRYRQRLSFSDQATLRTNLTATVVIREQSDAQVIRDFFEYEYRMNTQPKSFAEVNQLWPNFSLDVLAQPQLNNFFQTVERLPDVKLSAIRQQLGASPLFYEGENSVGYFRFQSGEANGTNYAAARADSFHQIVMPETFFGWLNVTPRIGGRFTHYGQTTGYSSAFDDRDRFVFNTGAEASFKASRVWTGVQNGALEVNGLRHIIQPSVNYVFVPSPNVKPSQLPQFDTEIPSLRLLPIDYPDYNAIDSIDSQNVLRLSLFNKLQTKRDGKIDNLVHWGLYTDWRLKPRPDQGTFADLFSDLDFKPRSWLTLNSEFRYDLDDGHVRMANHTATITPNNTWSLSLGHRYFRDDPAFGTNSGNNLFFERVYYRVNENWGFRMSHHFEARDGTMEEQYYTVYRDLRSWTAALTFRIRDNRIGPDDFAVAVTFSLKAFPRFKEGSDSDSPSLLLGG